MQSRERDKKFYSISAFDLDHTLLSENSSYRFGRYLCRKKVLSLSSLFFMMRCHFLHKSGLLSIEKLHEKAFERLFKGHSQLIVRECALNFFHENFDKLLYLPAIKKIESAQKEGHLVVILSSSPDFLVEQVAKRLHVSLWKSTQYSVDSSLCFNGIAKLIFGEDKASILCRLSQQYGVPKQNIFAYSDSHLDLPFLLAAGTACGVNPNRKLKAICRQNQWSMI